MDEMIEKQQFVPELRFSEFEDGWERNTLKNHKIMVIDGDRGKNYPKTNDFNEKGHCLFLNAKNVTSRGFEFFETAFITEEKDALLSKGKLKRNDLVLTTRGTVGNIAIYNDTVDYNHIRINSGMVILRAEEENIYGLFLSYIFISSNLIKLIKIVAFGSAQPQLTVKEINKFKFCLPSLKEQKKIANFLTAIDQRITLLKLKKAALEQYKKGLMQKIFSQEIRFRPDESKTEKTNSPLERGQGCVKQGELTSCIAKATESKNIHHDSLNEHPPAPPSRGEEIGNNYPDWEEKRLGDLASKEKWSFTGGPFGSDLMSKDYTEDGVRIIQLQNIGDGFFDESSKIYTSKDKADQLLSCNIYPGEILISKMGDPVARACLIPNKDKRYLMSSDGIRFVPDTEICNSYFMLQLINWRDFRGKAFSLSTGSTRKRIGLTDLRKIKLKLPCLQEQQKIANCLSAIDQSINQLTNQIDQTTQFKKGLLQRMFV